MDGSSFYAALRDGELPYNAYEHSFRHFVETLCDRAINEEDAESLRRIALGAVKFTDLGQDRKTNILFDWETMFNLQGYSCAYVQYAAVRINGILGKFGTASFNPASTYDWAAAGSPAMNACRSQGCHCACA